MTRENRLQLVAMHDAQDEAENAEAPVLTKLEGAGPDGGRRAHPATMPAGRRPAAARPKVEVENELVGFVCELLDAPETVVGAVTRSVYTVAMGALLAAREARSYLKRPTVVVADSVHPAFLAASEALGIVPVVVPTDHDGRAAVGPMATAITQETVLVVASAPSYQLGVVDPIAWLAAAATVHDVPLHVDATSGGWSLAYGARQGRVTSAWTFDTPGVTSIGIDLGPDEGLPAELGVLLHRTVGDRRGLRPQHALLDGLGVWEPAGWLLGEHAETLAEVGHEGCTQLALDALEATERIVEGLVDVRGVSVVGRPEATTIALSADRTCDVFTVADELHARGWAVQPIPSNASRSATLRLAVTAAALPLVEQCLTAFHEATEAARESGPRRLDPALDKMLATLKPERVNESIAARAVEAAGILDGRDHAAAVSRLVDAAPPAVRQALVALRDEQRRRPVRPSAVAPEPQTPASDRTDSTV